MAEFMAGNDWLVWTVFMCYCWKFNSMLNVL